LQKTIIGKNKSNNEFSNMYKVISTLIITVPVVAATGTIVCTNEIVEFNVIDTSFSPPLFTDLTPTVDLLDFQTCALNIEATIKSTPSNCDEQTAKCVKFFLDDVEVRKEKFAPFTLYGDETGGAINSRKPPIGTHTLKACTYSDKACTKNENGCKEMEVEFLDCDRPTAAPVDSPTAAPVDSCDSINEVTGFELVDTESPYRPVVTPFTPPVIDLIEFPTCALNIYATVSENTCGNAPIKCVKLTLGDQVRKEKFTPYALFGNTGRFIRSGKPSLGAQTLKACTYTDENCREGESGCLEVDVFVKDCVSMSM
jgi:hypothetical protein